MPWQILILAILDTCKMTSRICTFVKIHLIDKNITKKLKLQVQKNKIMHICLNINFQSLVTKVHVLKSTLWKFIRHIFLFQIQFSWISYFEKWKLKNAYPTHVSFWIKIMHVDFISNMNEILGNKSYFIAILFAQNLWLLGAAPPDPCSLFQGIKP